MLSQQGPRISACLFVCLMPLHSLARIEEKSIRQSPPQIPTGTGAAKPQIFGRLSCSKSYTTTVCASMSTIQYSRTPASAYLACLVIRSRRLVLGDRISMTRSGGPSQRYEIY